MSVSFSKVTISDMKCFMQRLLHWRSYFVETDRHTKDFLENALHVQLQNQINDQDCAITRMIKQAQAYLKLNRM